VNQDKYGSLLVALTVLTLLAWWLLIISGKVQGTELTRLVEWALDTLDFYDWWWALGR